ncbi:MAG: tetratricopeptide repeat protein [Bacteroidetes bacterium]|nr:MAG: tetratricopeptide repeat protein [Bacteroidota bacterium]
MNRILFILSLLLPFSLCAADPSALKSQGDAAYEAGNFEEALAQYEAVLAQGQESAGLYYNLGNTFYRLNRLGPSILNYERALKLDPGMKDARQNLILVRMRVLDNPRPPKELAFSAWSREVIHGRSSGVWAWASAILLWVAAGLGALFLFSGKGGFKRLGFFGGISCLVLALTAFGLSTLRRSRELDSRQGIIMVPNASVKSSAGGTEEQMVLHEGVKVEIVEPGAIWVRVRIVDRSSGEVSGYVKYEEVAAI